MTQDGKNFEKYLETINRQIKDIEKLVNEFLILQECLDQYLKDKFNSINKKSLDFIKLTSKNSINLRDNQITNSSMVTKSNLIEYLLILLKIQKSLLKIKGRKTLILKEILT